MGVQNPIGIYTKSPSGVKLSHCNIHVAENYEYFILFAHTHTPIFLLHETIFMQKYNDILVWFSQKLRYQFVLYVRHASCFTKFSEMESFFACTSELNSIWYLSLRNRGSSINWYVIKIYGFPAFIYRKGPEIFEMMWNMCNIDIANV